MNLEQSIAYVHLISLLLLLLLRIILLFLIFNASILYWGYVAIRRRSAGLGYLALAAYVLGYIFANDGSDGTNVHIFTAVIGAISLVGYVRSVHVVADDFGEEAVVPVYAEPPPVLLQTGSLMAG